MTLWKSKAPDPGDSRPGAWQAHLDFEPELPDSRESFQSVQSLDFDAVVLVIQHLPHQADVIGRTSRGLERVRRGGRDRRSGGPGSTVSQVLETSRCRHQPEDAAWVVVGLGVGCEPREAGPD